MVKKQKLLKRILNNPKDVSFDDAIKLAESFGFVLDRVSGSHHILTRPDIPELVNFQNVKGKTKPYQVKQFIAIIERHNLHLEGVK